MFDVPTDARIEKCIITRETVEGNKPPKLILDETMKKDQRKGIVRKQKVNNKAKNNKETA